MTNRFVYNCGLRWSDLDAYGHVNNARFLTLYEEARVALIFVGAKEAGFDSFEEGVVVSRHEIDYLRPIDYGDPVRIELWIEDLKRQPLHRRLRDVRRRRAGRAGPGRFWCRSTWRRAARGASPAEEQRFLSLWSS